jgi:hypothetical protein
MIAAFLLVETLILQRRIYNMQNDVCISFLLKTG